MDSLTTGRAPPDNVFGHQCPKGPALMNFFERWIPQAKSGEWNAPRTEREFLIIIKVDTARADENHAGRSGAGGRSGGVRIHVPRGRATVEDTYRG